MKKSVACLLALVSANTFAATDIGTLKSFRGSAETFRKELKGYLEEKYGVSCAKSRGETYAAFALGEVNFRMKVTCKSETLSIKAIAKMHDYGCYYEGPCFADTSVRSITVHTTEKL